MLERFKNEKLAIKFDSVEEQIEFLGIAEKEGFKWNSGDDPTKYAPSIYECISYNFDNSSGLGYSTETWFLQKYWQVITWKDYKDKYKQIKDNIVERLKRQVDFIYSGCFPKNITYSHSIANWNLPEQSKYPNNIEAIYHNEKKRTVVIKWKDGTTTKSTCSEEDNFDITVGFAMAYIKKIFNGKKKILRTIKKYTFKNKENKNE